MELKKIGIIRSPYKVRGDAPRQGKLSCEVMEIIIDERYKDAILGLRESQDIVVIYWGDRADRAILRSIPPSRDEEVGVFASRSPNRPNPLALNVAKIISIDDNIVKVIGLDCFDGSPLLDIKPYVQMLDSNERER